ncbi:MAG: glucose dehydrogenase [Gammaproteobacteria bacterium BRH_c0]|nr:MAG: glucose dehydrogenase [Gammaproteobacteria bacterium BRH_c0]
MSFRKILSFRKIIRSVLTVALVLAPVVHAQEKNYRVETLVEGLHSPYSLAFLPDGDMLVTEKSGTLRLIRNGTLVEQPVAQLPDVYSSGQGALTDVVPHPRFAQNRLVYLAYSGGTAKANSTRVVKARFVDDQLRDIEEIFRARPDKDTGAHFGARLVFLKDETLLITVGDGAQYREKAQDLSSMLGSIIRIGDDGSVPQDNPFVAREGAHPEIWSYGHRNPQGLIHDPLTDRVYATEHGPRGGDELNLIEAGNNYGWPLATYGVDYTGAAITPYQQYPGTVQPLTHWTPSLAPSGLAQCRSCLWPQWEGDIFAGMLMGAQVQRVRLLEGGEVEREGLFEEVGERIRDVRFGPDGALYLVTDNVDGRVLKVVPASP